MNTDLSSSSDESNTSITFARKPLVTNKKSILCGSRDFDELSSNLGTNYSSLQKWEIKFRTHLSRNMDILENISFSLDKRSEQSTNQYEFLIEFIKNKVVQFTKFSSHKIPSLKDSHPPIEAKQGKREINKSFILQSNFIDFLNQETQSSVKSFSNLLDKQLLKLLSEEQRSFIATMNKFRLKFQSQRKNILRQLEESKEKFILYSKIFENSMKSLAINKNPSQPLYPSEMYFLSLSHECFAEMKKLALFVLDHIQEVKKKEILRGEAIKSVLQQFSEQYRKLFVEDPKLKSVFEFFEDYKPMKEVESSFSLENFLTSPDLKYFAANKNQILDIKSNNGEKYEVEINDWRNIRAYFEGLELEKVEEGQLVKNRVCSKKLARLYKAGAIEKGEEWKDCIFIVTKDMWGLVSYDIMNRFGQPEIIIDLAKCSYKNDSEKLVVEISEKLRGMCKRDIKHYFKLDSQFEYEEILKSVIKE